MRIVCTTPIQVYHFSREYCQHTVDRTVVTGPYIIISDGSPMVRCGSYGKDALYAEGESSGFGTTSYLTQNVSQSAGKET